MRRSEGAAIPVSKSSGALAMAAQIEHWPIDRLVPYDRNPRTHSDDQVVQIAASIAEFGFTNPILVDTKAGIIAGHGRLLAARKLGLAKVPVIVLDHLSEAQKRAYIIADNKLALNAGWDDKLLAAELEALKLEDFDLDLTGFSDEEIEAFTSEDRFELPPLPETIQANIADLERTKLARKEANKATEEKNDTENYLVIVFPNRAMREKALAKLGLPPDERYITSDAVRLELIGKNKIHKKVAEPRHSGRAG